VRPAVGLHVGEVTAPSYGVVAYATGADGTPHVLKLCPPQSGRTAPYRLTTDCFQTRAVSDREFGSRLR
jgi:hypothetical protein